MLGWVINDYIVVLDGDLDRFLRLLTYSAQSERVRVSRRNKQLERIWSTEKGEEQY